MVHKCETLVIIVSNLFDARLGKAEAMENVAKAANEKVDAGTRSQLITAAYEVLQQAKAAYEVAKAGVGAAESQYSLAKSGAQKEDKVAAEAMVNVAKGGVNEVNALLEDQYLTAPFDGEITEIYPNVSELVATGAPIMNLQRDDHWVVFNVRETLLKDIKMGSVLKIRIPALDIHTEAKVYYIKDLGTYANWQATKSTGDFDARTFQIKARPIEKIENLRPGMSIILEEKK